MNLALLPATSYHFVATSSYASLRTSRRPKELHTVREEAFAANIVYVSKLTT